MLLDVAERLPSIDFTMVGGKLPDAPELYEEAAARAAALPNVAFLGSVPFNEMGELYARAQVLVCTSEIEGFPNTFLQAWASGTPVVSTVDADGVIATHRLGTVCEAPDEMADEIEVVLSEAASSRELGDRCRGYVQEHHGPDVVVRKLDGLLRKAL